MKRLLGIRSRKNKTTSGMGETQSTLPFGGSVPAAPTSPAWQYAVQEYRNTIAPSHSNDDGRSMGSGGVLRGSNRGSLGRQQMVYRSPSDRPTEGGVREEDLLGLGDYAVGNEAGIARGGDTTVERKGDTMTAAAAVGDSVAATEGTGCAAVSGAGTDEELPKPPSLVEGMGGRRGTADPEVDLTRVPTDPFVGVNRSSSSNSSSGRPRLPENRSSSSHISSDDRTNATPPPYTEPAMPDATYEEYYGDAYVGAPIKYIYPSGYQSMRPRSGPWKLSVFVFVLFTWLSVFTVGHCSDRASAAGRYYNVQAGSDIDDDVVVIETRWCGSRLLYFMWVLSMAINGVAMAYCGIIGYIKVRDFAVANCRSQPPGMVGRSDYYIRIEDAVLPLKGQEGSPTAEQAGGYQSYQSNGPYRNIYQSDGTPQFWGGHIYRPTQAAVAVTSR